VILSSHSDLSNNLILSQKYLIIRKAKQQQSGGSQASGEEQYFGKLLIHTFIHLYLRRARAGAEWW
jgi:hypothetical protein